MQRRILFASLAAILLGVSAPTAWAESELDAMAQRAKVQHSDVPRKVLTFYYPWYSNPEVEGGSGQGPSWKGTEPAREQIDNSTHYPQLGPYDSHAPELIAQHCAWCKEAGIDGLIVSWWGKGSFTDRAMEKILDACQESGLEVTIYYETVPEPQTPGAAAEDVLYVLNQYGDHPAWLSVDDNPVVFVYGRAVGELGLAGWVGTIAEVNRRYSGQAVFLGDQFSPAAARVFDGVHTYNPVGSFREKSLEEIHQWCQSTYPEWVAMADACRRISTITVIPGYDDTKIREPGLAVGRFGGKLYKLQWEQVLEADPHWALITSFNEWYEGSEIEPSAEYGTQYLEQTAEWAARFKAKGPRHNPPEPAAGESAATRSLSWLGDRRVGLLPDLDSMAVWSLLKLPLELEQLSWEEVSALGAEAVQQMPVLVYAGGEKFRPTVDTDGDVIDGLQRFLRAGGILVVLPAQPMPFHYNEEREVVAAAGRLGLPLSVGGEQGGWEQPPEAVDLRFVQPEHRLPQLPESFAFPSQGDLRWRPLVRTRLAEEDVYIPLLHLTDELGNDYGDAVGYIEHRASEPRGGTILYAWFGLLNGPHGEALVEDVFAFLGSRE